MIVRQLRQSQYDDFRESLRRNAQAEPQDAGYTVKMTVNGAEYAVKVQPERHCKVAVLQARRIYREQNSPGFELITEGNLLSSFLELLIYQGVSR
ncbi:conserved protein of unknown function [Ruminococcaceae bacterium BL-6]|nr:conserved protein of unknown function [Ruminococcaceae bacterium BL-6]